MLHLVFELSNFWFCVQVLWNIIMINNSCLFCWSFDILAFEKQLMIVSLVTFSKTRTSIFVASRTLNDWISLLFSRAVIIHLTDKTLCFEFSNQITPWSIAYVWKVLVGGRNTNSMAINDLALTSGCAGQMSRISDIFLFLRPCLRNNSSRRVFLCTISKGLVLESFEQQKDVVTF